MAPVRSKMGRKLDNVYTSWVLYPLQEKQKLQPGYEYRLLEGGKQGRRTTLQSNDYPPYMLFPRTEYVPTYGSCNLNFRQLKRVRSLLDSTLSPQPLATTKRNSQILDIFAGCTLPPRRSSKAARPRPRRGYF